MEDEESGIVEEVIFIISNIKTEVLTEKEIALSKKVMIARSPYFRTLVSNLDQTKVRLNL